jgi:hypothetical protein
VRLGTGHIFAPGFGVGTTIENDPQGRILGPYVAFDAGNQAALHDRLPPVGTVTTCEDAGVQDVEAVDEE